MKKYLSRKHADKLKRIYMKADLENEVMMRVENRKAGMYDILAGRRLLSKPYEMHISCSTLCSCRN